MLAVKPWNSVVEIPFLNNVPQYFENVRVWLSVYLIGITLELLKLLQLKITEAHPMFSSFWQMVGQDSYFFLLEDKNVT